ncbi:hypothetical protein Tco_1142021, partial [Tanacetum coccineum]
CMTMSSNKELVTSYKEPERFEEEVVEAIGEPTMEEYMTKTKDDYGSGIARPKIDEKAKFELKGQFLKNCMIILSVDRIMKMQMNTFKGSDLVYKGLDVPTRQILDSKGAIPSMKTADAKNAIQDMYNTPIFDI